MVPLLRVSQNCDQVVGGTVFSSGGSTGKETPSKLTHILDRIHSLEALRSSIPAFSWLLTRGCPKFLTTWAAYFIKPARSVSRMSLLPRQNPLLLTQSQEEHLITFTMFYWLEASHGPSPHSRVNIRKQGLLGRP